MAGFPGMADTPGLSAVNGYIGLRHIRYGNGLPASAHFGTGITDFMSAYGNKINGAPVG
ncbi:MAG: hypothetical protein IPH22_16405 [Nitrosomonas sp.]|nr:hypothetical protein [Nitrosomonas sp.]